MSSEQSKSQAKRVAIEQGRSVHSKPAIPMQVRPDMSKESVDAIVEHLRTVREDHAADLIEQLHARNAEQAAEIARTKVDAQLGRAVEGWVCMNTPFTGDPPYVGNAGIMLALAEMKQRHDALLDGIEGLEKEWRRVTDPYTKGIVGRCADYLRALREKANGSQAAEQGGRGDA